MNAERVVRMDANVKFLDGFVQGLRLNRTIDRTNFGDREEEPVDLVHARRQIPGDAQCVRVDNVGSEIARREMA